MHTSGQSKARQVEIRSDGAPQVKIASVMTVRNEVDVLPLNIAYHRSIGITDFWIVDNGSTDGTTSFLREFANANPWLRWRSEPGAFHQSEFITAMAQEAFRSGAEWIVPADADEFWSVEIGQLAEVLARSDAGALVCQVQNFVQDRRVTHDPPSALLTMTHRAEQRGTAASARELVESGAIAFVEIVYPPKVVSRATSSLIIHGGNHSVDGAEGRAEPSGKLSVLHAPIRSLARLELLAEHGRRSAEANPNPEHGWHVRRWAELESLGLLASDWATNSQRHGALTLADGQRRVSRDLRLREAVKPFVSITDRLRARAVSIRR